MESYEMTKTKKLQKVTKKEVLNPYRNRESNLFALWLSMPFVLRELPSHKLATMGYDIEDEEFMLMVKTRTRTEFAIAVGISRKQLNIWENSEIILKKVTDFNLKSNVLRFKKDIDYHFTQATIRESDAARVKLWKQLFEGWQEKGEISNPAMTKAIQAQTKVMQALANRK